MCSNPPGRLRRLFDTLDTYSSGQVNEPKTTALEVDGGLVDRIPYSPRRHLISHEIEELVADYQAGSTAKELGGRWGSIGQRSPPF